jgi:methyl-accepting chemotaxis protein
MTQGFRDAKLTTKALVISCVFILLALAIGISGMLATKSVSAKLAVTSDQQGPSLAYISEARARLINIERATLDHLLAQTPGDKTKIEEELARYRTEMFAFLDSVKATPGQTAGAKTAVDQMLALNGEAKAYRTKVLEASRGGKSAEGYRLAESELKERANKVDAAMTAFNNATRADMIALNASAVALDKTITLLMLGGFAVIIAIGVLIIRGVRGYLDATVVPLVDRMQRLQRNCVSNLEQGLSRMASGDLGADVQPTTTPLDTDSKDEIGQLAASFNGILGMVQSTVASFSKAQGAVRGLITETQSLVTAGKEGRLDARGHEAAHHGAFRDVVAGFNATLDAIIAPMSEAAEVLEQVAAKDLTARVHGDYKGDHAKIKVSLNTAVESMQGAFWQISGSAQQLAGASEEFSATSAQMGQNADESSARVNEVAAAAEQLARNSQSVATATEEMTASIREIAQNASQAARVANEAVDVTRTANATVTRLGASSDQIGEVVRLITTIAEQTNLLALNATIEAARAGEAGKGFAVVANEVKELAKATARATGEIGQQVSAIQADSKHVAEAIEEISRIIGQINDIQSAIAGAVEEQSATTNEMGRNVAESASGVNGIAQSITHVARTSVETAEAAQASNMAAGSLATLATELQALVADFRIESKQGGRVPSNPSHRKAAAHG